MLRRKKVASNFDSVIGKNTALKGDIECSGSLRIDGSVTGDIKTDGNVLLGKDGFIKGKTEAVNVNLSGTVEGNIRATGILRILSSAKLYGDVEVKSFVADEGAIFQGSCKMLDIEEDKPKARTARIKSRNRSAGKSEEEDRTEGTGAGE
jgi:cytoskeletal protein CcmA (bactofilin family)